MVKKKAIDDDTSVTKVENFVERSGNTAAYLIVIASKVPGLLGRMLKLDKADITIGRGDEAHFQIDDKGVSRKHAAIHCVDPARFELADLGSTNGTLYNGQKIEGPTFLHDGDKIQIGSNVILKFSMQDQLDEEYQRSLYESVVRDSLTGTYNKKFFTETLQKEFAYAVRHRSPLSVIILDVDHFKKVNDTYGHICGDLVLEQISRTVGETIRAEDLLARYGGEEFGLILRQTHLEEGMRCAERCRLAVERLDTSYEGKSVRVTISLGVATLSGDNYAQPDQLIQAADEALYRAKEAGRNRIEATRTEAPARTGETTDVRTVRH